MKIGILQPAGIAAEIVSKAFSLQEMQELYKPVIYSKENQNDKNVLPDLREGKINAFCVAPGSNFNIPDASIMSVTPQVKVITAIPAADIQTVYNNISLDTIKEKIKLVATTLRRDFGNTAPRIALLALNASPDTQEKEILEPAVRESLDNGLSVHGPYLLDAFISEQKYAHFDAVIAITDQQQEALLKAVSDDAPIRLYLGMPYVITVCTGETPEDIQQTYYLTIDCTRSRRVFDKASASPLPKLYHEHREDGEKARFSVKRPPFMKPKENADDNADANKEE